MAAERIRHMHIERAAAVAILAVLVAGAGWGALAPMAGAAATRAEVLERLARYERTIEAPASAAAAFDPNELAARHADDAEAQLSLQALLDRLARAQALAVQSLRPSGEESFGELGRMTWVELDAVGDLQALADFLAALDKERPVILLRVVEAETGAGPRPDASLRVRVEAGRVWRPGEAP
jgi:hypothetical protein